MADLTIDIAPPPPSTAPVVVRPIPASSSRLIWLGHALSVVGGILALIPELVSQPLVVAWVNAKMSPDARWTIAVAVAVIGYIVQRLRKTTIAPIAGTPSAEAAQPANYVRAQSAPASTEGESQS